MKVLRVDAAEHPEVCAERGASSFAGVAMDLAVAVSMIIPCPFMDTVADRGVGRMTPPVALPLVGIELRATGGHVRCDQGATRPRIGMVADPEALCTRFP
jgi:hypothetical protein